MGLYSWLVFMFIAGGLTVLLLSKKVMEKRVEWLKEAEKSLAEQKVIANSVIWWIIGAVVWGLTSIFLVIKLFAIYF